MMWYLMRIGVPHSLPPAISNIPTILSPHPLRDHPQTHTAISQAYDNALELK